MLCYARNGYEDLLLCPIEIEKLLRFKAAKENRKEIESFWLLIKERAERLCGVVLRVRFYGRF